MDTAQDVMTKKVITCKPSDTILEARDIIIKHRISRVVVIDTKNRPVGIITQKDIVNFLFADKSSRSLEEIPAEEVMNKKLVTLTPTTHISQIATTMVKKKISSLIVVDEKNELKGIITKADIVMYLASLPTGIYGLRDFITLNPITVRRSDSIFKAAALMDKNKVSRVVVISNENKSIGIITLADLVMTSPLVKPERVSTKGNAIIVKGFITLPVMVHLLTVGDIMTGNPIIINKDSDLTDAAKLMTRHRISGLPVTDNNGELVGIITRTDLTRAVASIKQGEP